MSPDKKKKDTVKKDGEREGGQKKKEKKRKKIYKGRGIRLRFLKIIYKERQQGSIIFKKLEE